MVGALSEIFGRNFAMGHLLPGTVFAGVSLLLLDRLDVLPFESLLGFYGRYPVLVAVFAPLLLFLWAISLLAANMQILRLREGYPLQRFSWAVGRQLRQCRALRRRIEACGDESQAMDLRLELATRFPDHDELVLPTRFGNVLCAAESYAPTLYGMEATCGWSRLLAIMPRDQRELVDNAKAEVDLLVNLWLLSWLFLAEYLALGWYTGRFASLWFPAFAVGSLILSSYFSIDAAARWGEILKSCFDVFLPDLRRQLGLPVPVTRAAEWEMWRDFSAASQTRQPRQLPPLAPQGPRPVQAAQARS